MIDREKLEEALITFAGWGNQDWDCSLNPKHEIVCQAAREYAKILPHIEKMVEADKEFDADKMGYELYSCIVRASADQIINDLRKEIGDE